MVIGAKGGDRSPLCQSSCHPPHLLTCLCGVALPTSICLCVLCGLQEEADELARQVKVKVHQLAGGVGELSQ